MTYKWMVRIFKGTEDDDDDDDDNEDDNTEYLDVERNLVSLANETK